MYRLAVFFTVSIIVLICGLFASLSRPVSAQSGPTGKIAFAYGGSGNTSVEIFTINPDGTGQTRLTNNSSSDRFPAWSPDGAQLAFESDRDGGTYNIFRMLADGSAQEQLTNSSYPIANSDPAWSPDGQSIAFVTNREGAVEIWKMSANGSNPVRLTVGEPYNTNSSNPVYSASREPAWSPDGSKIAFSSYRNGNFNLDIYVMNADGSNPVRLTTNSADDFSPAWSPDGSKIAFSSMRDGNGEIYLMNADGSNQVNITNFPAGSDGGATWSPDGSKIAFSRLENFFNSFSELYVMNAAGGSAPVKLTANTSDSSAPAWQTFHTVANPLPTPTPGPVYSVSGRVVDGSQGTSPGNSPGIPGITMTLSGTVSATTQTDANGFYMIGNLPKNGNYTIAVSTTNWGFASGSQSFDTINTYPAFINGNLTVNFQAAPIYCQYITATYSAFEGSSAYITVTREGYVTGTSTIDYATSDGTAKAGTDYIAASGRLQFAPGESMKSFLVPLIYDGVVESGETINLTLSNPTGSTTRGQTTAVLTVNDPFPLLLTEGTGTRAIALDALTQMRDPFPLFTNYLGSDAPTRISLFALYVDLQPGEDASVVTAEAEDAGFRTYPVTVEYVGKVPNFNWLSQVVVKLPDNLPTGEVLIRIALRGHGSNQARIRIK